MARRLISTVIRMKGGPTLGGSPTRVTVYDDEALTVVSTTYRRATGVGQQPNALPTGGGPHFTPNAGKQTTLRSDVITTDTVLPVVSIAGFAVGDLVPIYDATNLVWRVITALNAVGPTMTLDSALGFNFDSDNTFVNRPSMRGHIWFWVEDLRDYFVQPYDVGAGEKMPPLQIPTQVPATTLALQDEGAAVAARGTVNFKGARVRATDDAGNARVNVEVTGGGGNILVNPGFEIWQRGTGAFTASLAYCADRWQLSIAGTDTLSVSREGTTKKANSLYAAVCTFVLGNGAGATRLRQRLVVSDGHHYLLGQPVSFRFPLRVSAATAARAYIATDGTGGTTTYSGYHTGAAAYEDLDVTNVVVPTDATYVEFGVAFAASCTAYTDNSMATPGESPEPYVSLMPAEEWDRCQRYYEVQGGVTAEIHIKESPDRAAGLYVARQFTTRKAATAATMTKNGTWTVVNAGAGDPAVAFAGPMGYRLGYDSIAAGPSGVQTDSADDTIVAESNP